MANPAHTLLYKEEFVHNSVVFQAMTDKEQIGWDQFLKGRIAVKWQEMPFLPSYKKEPEVWSQHLIYEILQLGCRL